MKVQPSQDISSTSEAGLRLGARRRICVIAASIALVCSGVTSCTKTQVALSSAAIAAVVVGTTVGVTYAVKHHNHTLQGCVFSDAGGLKLRTSDAKVYVVRGATANIKVGDRVSVHGSKVTRVKGDSTGDRGFVVQRLNEDYGPCPANVAAAPMPVQ